MHLSILPPARILKGGESPMIQIPESLKTLLLDKKSIIITKWFNYLCHEYPDKTVELLKSDKSQFANPVGSNMHDGLQGIFEELLQDMGFEKMHIYLDKIIRIKAVQDFSPSKAIAFIFILKRVIREELHSQLGEEVMYKELAVIEKRIDDIALVAFEVYSKCRETIYQIRIDEVKKRCDISERINTLNQ